MRIRILRMIVENFMNYVEKTFDFSDFTREEMGLENQALRPHITGAYLIATMI